MSEIKVNKISPRSGTTVTLGDSGDTFTIPSGATINNQGTATNFGATGSASWVTTVKTNSDSGFTAVAGEGYFLDTTSGTISVNLPAGTAGAVVAFKDYAGTFDTNAVTLVPNGSDKIGGVAANATLETEGIAVTLVFIDSTQGWLVTDSGLQSESPTALYIAATGGNATVTCGSFKTHIFTGPGTFTVCSVGNACGSNTVEYLVVAGAAGGSSDWGGGSGAGGMRTRSISPSAHPINAPANLPVSAQGYPITVGAAGSIGGQNELGGQGSSSIFSTITSAGGGRAGNEGNNGNGGDGGSGGGGGTAGGPGPGVGGTGNTPPVSPPQGNPGGQNTDNGTGYTAGGGGAGGAGEGLSPGCNSQIPGGAGGIGAYIVDGFIGPTAPSYGTSGPVSNTRYFAGGGGGAAGSSPRTGGAGGSGGGGTGGVSTAKGTDGTVNTGGGGGGGSGNESPNPGSGGGSGIVMIRYKFQ
jgi:hypothetical protein